MITSRLSTELEQRAVCTAKDLNLTVSDLVRIGLIRVLDEYQATGSIEIRPVAQPAEVAP